jgi:hypothetical protein
VTAVQLYPMLSVLYLRTCEDLISRSRDSYEHHNPSKNQKKSTNPHHRQISLDLSMQHSLKSEDTVHNLASNSSTSTKDGGITQLLAEFLAMLLVFARVMR